MRKNTLYGCLLSLCLFVSAQAVLLILPQTTLLAQFTLADRHEVYLDKGDNARWEYEVINLRQKGILLISYDAWKFAKSKEFKFEWLDTTLQVQKSRVYILPQEFTENRRVYYDRQKFVYLFAQNINNTKEFKLFRLNIEKEESELFEAIFPLKLNVEGFKAAEETAYIIGNYQNKSVVVSFNFIDKQPRILPSFFEDKEEIKEIQADVFNNQVNFVIGNADTRICKLYIKPYSSVIGSKKRLEIKGKEREVKRRTFKNAKVYSLDNKKQLVLGTYSYNCSEYLQGLFMTRFENDEQQGLNFHRFADFGNFFKNYNDRRADKLQKKIEKLNEEGKDFPLNRKLFLHQELLDTGNELVVVLDGYTLQYSNSNNFNASQAFRTPTMFPGGRPLSPQTVTYNYHYSIICGFDKQGRKVWDNLMRIKDAQRTGLAEVTQVGFLKDSIVIAYLEDEKVFSKMTYRYQERKEETEQTIKDILKDYPVAETYDDQLMHWYDNHFLLFGEQRLKNSGVVEGTQRKGFHFSKLSYYPQPEKPKENAKAEKKE
jgi:hypothetical protein